MFQAGRTDRKEFVRKRLKMNPHASTSNKEKRRTKNFMMMRHSQNVRTKGKRSFREKQVTGLFKKNKTMNYQIRLNSICMKYEEECFVFFMSNQSCFLCFSACSTRCASKKEEALQVGDVERKPAITWPLNLTFDHVNYLLLWSINIVSKYCIIFSG